MQVTLKEANKMLWTLYDEGYTGIFHVTFKKKDGTVRKMSCLMFVKKYLKGGSIPYDFRAKNYMPVFDNAKGKEKKKDPEVNPYRMINLNSLINFSVEKGDFQVEEFIHA